MFDDNSKDLTATLAEMHRVARIKSNFSETDAKEKMRKWIKQDSRFGEFDAAKLADRVNECIQSGATLDLDDPVLKGGEKRPLDRRYG